VTELECNIQLLQQLAETKAEIHELRNDLNQIWKILLIVLTFSLGINTYDAITPKNLAEPIQTIPMQSQQ